MQTNTQTRKVLLIKHSKGWDVDRVNRWADNRGHVVDRCYPADGDPFPKASDYDGVVVFGGAMSANDCEEKPWLLNELSFIQDCLDSHCKFFGICLGAQLLARVLGAKVCEPDCGTSEVGFYPLQPVGDSQFLKPGDTMLQWHREGFELPKNANLLASSEAFPNQAFELPGGHFGVQFHPEVNPDSLRIWHSRIPAEKYPWLTPELRQEHLQICEESDARITQWTEALLDDWIS